MDNQHPGISQHTVNLSRHALKQMIRVVHDLQNLSENPLYPSKLSKLAGIAQVHAQNYSVLMAYDFHVTDTQEVKLIEVNTNAGGLWLACGIEYPSKQPLPEKLARQLLSTFIQEYQLFIQNVQAKPKLIAIVDQLPEQQFLYPEMQGFVQLFKQAEIDCIITDPSEITANNSALYYKGQHIDLIYNRHCDFYLASPEMQVIAQAWQQQSVCLTPNPRTYGLLADKQRMVDWSQSELLAELFSPKIVQRLRQAIPKTQILGSLDQNTTWSERKKLVFKPTTGHASRGVYIGDKLTKGKFNSFDPQTTLVQERIKPSITITEDNTEFKTDFRLFVYRHTILAACARIYQGQVTNLRTPNGGFSQLNLTHSI
ncbi:MAG: hypothetical protein K9L22_11945 [Methylococcaceae bacterium]|nr:hypothetical protein [Methylococcaceae bacterium]